MPSPFADWSIKSLRLGHDEIISLGALRGLDDLSFRRPLTAIGDILPDAGRKQEGVLKNHPDLGTKGSLGQGLQILPIKPDNP